MYGGGCISLCDVFFFNTWLVSEYGVFFHAVWCVYLCSVRYLRVVYNLLWC